MRRRARHSRQESRAVEAASAMLVVDETTRAREHVALRSMFAARKRVFVDLLKWDLPVLAGRFEVDRRDGPGATYLIVSGPDGEHRASARLLAGPSAALAPFGGRLYESAARASRIAEVTHFCLSPDIAAADRRRARDRLLYGLVDHALTHRIQRFVGIAERRWARPIEELGWSCRRLGGVPACGKAMVGIAVDIDAATPARLAEAGIARPTAAGRMPS
ncbi:acyl-homoserine-lactone synthase [Sphingopyxis sp. LARHCG72]